ncbi:Wzz/FepE/Etk N-terminal domain-containing protein [Natronoflexus pectinivorans]|uniref:LPS O-antigen subunit length determinant protein (WzzB/FepE family) n=1 Tax=Natronoflexus pectinivorans TaxID=682526 RepID=A0A4R2GHM9_9BACT|nr:Wzz/FepE/Etk N-terminal domain-containing protein [Natronoflexus pectinivorans]TCO07886.1 LPS O-antigen subunit length determinant protein (WzzB/FepE family) [Natronoflexus pectinivorans]
MRRYLPDGAHFRKVMNGDKVDLLALFKNVWLGRKIVLSILVLFVVVGLFIALFSPVKYSSGAVLLPQVEGQKELGQFSNLASLAGVNLASMFGEATGIPPDLYPNIVGSYPFLHELMSTKFRFKNYDEPLNLYQYKIEEGNRGVIRLIRRYTVRLPWTLKDAIFPPKEIIYDIESSEADGEIVFVGKETLEHMEEVLGDISVEVSTRTGLVYVSVVHEDPFASAQIANKTVELLQQYIVEYKTKQVTENLKFVEMRFNEVQEQFNNIQKELYQFRDAHRNFVEERISLRFHQLNDEYLLMKTVHQGLAQQLEQSRLAVKKETPAFSIIEPVKVPVMKSSPRRAVIMIVSVLLGGAAGFITLYGVIVYYNFKKLWANDDASGTA